MGVRAGLVTALFVCCGCSSFSIDPALPSVSCGDVDSSQWLEGHVDAAGEDRLWVQIAASRIPNGVPTLVDGVVVSPTVTAERGATVLPGEPEPGEVELLDADAVVLVVPENVPEPTFLVRLSVFARCDAGEPVDLLMSIACDANGFLGDVTFQAP